MINDFGRKMVEFLIDERPLNLLKIGDSIMKTKYHIYLTGEERIAVINSLIDLRNDLISRCKYTDIIDELIIKFTKAKVKKIKIKEV